MALQHFIIEANDYLRHVIQAYYRCDYIKYRHPNNPDYLVTLKNTNNRTPRNCLIDAAKQLSTNLPNEIREILSASLPQPTAICVIPRAKSLASYSQDQLVFRRVIQKVVSQLKENNHNIIDGTDYIIRHTDTRTTHLPNDKGNGSDPYPGITKDTCTLSTEIQGKNILLIDDIYTKTINVDEDAIQALLDAGAKNVTFFAIAKTIRKQYAPIRTDTPLSVDDIVNLL